MKRPVISVSVFLFVVATAFPMYASPISALRVHLRHHSSAAVKERHVLVVLDCQTTAKRKVQVGDVVYSLEPTRIARFYVPVGTPVFPLSTMRTHASGELLTIASAATNGKRIVID